LSSIDELRILSDSFLYKVPCLLHLFTPEEGIEKTTDNLQPVTDNETGKGKDGLRRQSFSTCDSMGNLSTIKDSLNNTINYTYDSEGNRITEQIKDSAGSLQKSLSYSYDALNRRSKIINPDNNYTQYTYDALGNKKTAKDPKGNITTYSYDALNRLTSVIQPGSITTSYSYNSNSNLTSVADANNNATTYKFSDTRKVYQIVSPDTGTTTYQYDAAGNLTGKTDAKGIAITYTYDALNRLTQISFPDSAQNIAYAYDNCLNGKGRLCRTTDPSGTITLEYTAKGQIKKETKTIDSIQYVTQYSYDMNGNMKTMTYPSGRVITYNYTNDKAVSVLNNAANLATNISYKPFGGMSSLTYGNGIASSISYDNQYRVTSIAAGTVMNLSYSSYDANGNITGIVNNLDAAKNKSYSYDALDRLISATGSWGSLTWTYDSVGNRLTENTNSYTYASNTNKLINANGKTFGYDNNGNTTIESARQYIYNQNQRLIQVNDGATTANYTYNGSGQRIKKIVNGATTIFHYSINGQIIAESDNVGTINVEYVYLNGKPLAKIDSSGVNYIHIDHIGTPIIMTDATGAKIWAIETKPFGDGASITGSATLNFRFTGQYSDQETGNNQNGFRDYASQLDRYIESDPLGISRGKNHLYIYVRSNPNRWTDIFGLQDSGKTCPPKTKCKEDADKQYNKCMEGMKLTGTTVTVICVGSGVLAGIVGSTATPLVGVAAGVITTAGCFLVPDIDTLPGQIWCGFLRDKAYQACDTLGEP
jgi:RHS repeat-associated protein